MKLHDLLNEETYTKVPFHKKKKDINGLLIFKYLDKTITYGVLNTCSYLGAGKEYILRIGKRDRNMEWVFKNISEKCTIPLYRGVKEDELKKLLANEPINYYTSYSEDKKIAKKFGTVITVLPPCKAFKYYEFMTKLHHEDSSGHDDVDDAEIAECQREKEWITPFNLRLEVVDSKKLIFKVK